MDEPTPREIKARAMMIGLPLMQLYEEAGIAASVVNKWQRGQSFPTQESIDKLLAALAKHEGKPKRRAV